METKVSEKGEIVIPPSLRRRLGIKPGDRLNADLKDKSIILSLRPERNKTRKARIIEDPITGLPVIDVGEDAPILTSKMVREMLADFP
ncbi:MAG: AbrB/MazE/SpoVT family DNA-binding domain-containing protein [Pyrinomonadaceae bacterium]